MTAKSGPETMGLSFPLSEKPGDIIGRYKLLQEIGVGGFGVVYMAEQEEPVRRRVALKIIKLGMDTKEVIARFEAERQALALMEHPHIAKVLDAGATAGGRPYFVMELVRGERITEYCDKHNLSTRQRLDLFVQVCHAIQHAHQKGIIHRDIKPSNVLVSMQDGVPMPKVIDFGIAKATAQRLTDKTFFTAMGDFVGTPAYMSPEQAEMTGLDIDTRSDIYSLGVLLYELLVGTTPFDAFLLSASGVEAMRRTIREVEPVRPSTRFTKLKRDDLTTTAKHRSTPPARLLQLLKGDLDWIVMKCLEKDRTRRYETANGLALDLQRHINSEPVLARPPSKAYQFQKMARRHKAAFIFATCLIAVLISATAISAWQALRATRAEKLAKQRLTESEAISKFLTEVFQSPDPSRDGRSVTVAETLGRASKKLESDLADQPARRAKLQTTLGMTYFALGLSAEAISLQEKVRDYDLDAYGQESPDTLTAMHNLAYSYDVAGRRPEALKLQEQVLAARRKVLGPEHPDTLAAMHRLAIFYDEAGRREEALKLREQVLALRRKVLGPEHPDTLRAMNNLAISYDEAGRHGEALKLKEEVLPLFRKVSGPEHPDTLNVMDSLAVSYDEAGRLDEAIKMGEEMLALRRKVLGPEHPKTLKAMSNLGSFYFEAGRRDEALKLAEEMLALRSKVLGPEHPDTLAAMGNLAVSYDAVGRREEALKLREQALALRRKVLGPEHPDTLRAMNNLAISYDEAGRLDDSLKLREQVLDIRRKVSGPEQRETLLAMQNVAVIYCSLGRSGEAISLLENVCKADSKNTDASLTLATWQTWFGHDADYEAARRTLVQEAQGTEDAGTAERAAKAACLRSSTNAALLSKALELAQKAVELGHSSPAMPWYQLTLGLVEYRNGQFTNAEQTLARAEQKLGEYPEILGIDRLFRVMSLSRQNRLEEARKLFCQAEAHMPPLPADDSKPLVNGSPVTHDDLICWMAYREAKQMVERPLPVK